MESRSSDNQPLRRPSVSTHSSNETSAVIGQQDGLATAGPARRMSRVQRRLSSVIVPGMGPRYSLGPGAFRSHAMALAILRERHAMKDMKKDNTYKTEPDQDQKFQVHKVRKVIEEVLEHHCEDECYGASSAGMLTRTLTDIIKARVKDLNFERHKIVVHVVVGAVQSQGFEMASRCLWNTGQDNYASATFANNSIFAVATVYGIYFE
ncbi:dynein light chain Tctex-type 5-like [Glandiceps talaboti]